VILGKGDHVFVRALNVLLVGAAEPSLELVVQFVEVSEVELAILAPLAHTQTSGLSFDLNKNEKCLNIEHAKLLITIAEAETQTI
jgi:hypothetical protein